MKWSEVTQLCPTLCNPIDCSSLPGSSLHGILQARILEWVAISFSRDLANSGIEAGSPALQADTLTSEKPGKQGRSFLLLGAKNKVVAKASSFWRLQERTGSLSLCRGIPWLVAISSNLCFYCYFAFSSLTSCLTSIRTLYDYNMLLR